MSRLLTRIRLMIRSIFRRSRVDQELEEELRYHLERESDEQLRTGLTMEGAEFAARRAMGATTQNKEACRDMRRVSFVEDLVQDVRYTIRICLPR